jgi:hypothetical protein
LDDRRPLLRHRLEVGALHVPRQVEVELLVHVTLLKDHTLRVLDAHYAERNLIAPVLLVELPDLPEALGEARQEFIDLPLIVDRVNGRIALLRGKAVVLLERRLQERLGVLRVHIGDRTIRVMILVGPALGDQGTWTPAARRATLRVADGREDGQRRSVNAAVLVRLDLILPRLARLRDAPAVVQLATQVLAAIEDERILAVRVAQEARAWRSLGCLVVRRHLRVEHRAVDAGDAFVVGQPLIGIDDADLVGEPLLRVDERAADAAACTRTG